MLWHNAADADHYFILEKDAANELVFRIQNGVGAANEAKVSVISTNYAWSANEWVHIQATWDGGAAVGDQLHIYFNGVEPPHTDLGNPYNAATMPVGTNTIGADSGHTSSASGIIDEIRVYRNAYEPTPLAYGGLMGHPDEFLADGSKNFDLGLQGDRFGQPR